MNRTIQVFSIMFFLTTAATAADGPGIKLGNELFKSPALGTNGRSCATCHPNGKGLEDAADYNNKTLAEISNQCLVKALNGKPLTDGSLEQESLVMYLKTLGSAKAD